MKHWTWGGGHSLIWAKRVGMVFKVLRLKQSIQFHYLASWTGVVKGARMEKMLASDWSSDVITGSGMGNRWPVGKRDRGLMQPEVTWFRRRNRWRVWKMDRGLKVGENRGENAGSKSKVQFGEEGWSLKNNTKWNKSRLLICFTITVVFLWVLIW